MDISPDKTLTADLCDSHDAAKVVPGTFTNFGAGKACLGPVEVITTENDNSLVSSTVREPGNGRILVVDNGGSTSCAMVGGDLGRAAHENGWLGIIVDGAIRDVIELEQVPIAIFARTSCPRKSVKRGIGTRGEPISFSGISVSRDDIAAADADGVIFIAAADFSG